MAMLQKSRLGLILQEQALYRSLIKSVSYGIQF